MSNLHAALTECIIPLDCRTIIHVNVSIVYFYAETPRWQLLVVEVPLNASILFEKRPI